MKKEDSPTLRKLLSLFLIACIPLYSLAQEQKVSGVVVDTGTAKPIEGVTVKVKNGNARTLTKEDGSFTISVPSASSILEFSYVGYEVYQMSAGQAGRLTINLKSLNQGLDDVIVVGYGETRKRTRTTGAISSIKAKEVEDLPVANIAAALRGRIAGLTVNSVSGRPGAGVTLNVRDATSASDVGVAGATAEPLYVIDNMIVGKSTFDNLDPTMVDEITILKDASAAIYGAAGAKGVILITTKRGKAGPPTITYNGYAGITDAVRKTKMLSAYDHAKLLNESFKITNTAYNQFFSDADLEVLKNMNYKSWFDEIWQSAFTQRHGLNISGGSERSTFFIGGSYQNQNANYAGMKSDRFTLRSGVNVKLAQGLSAEINSNVDVTVQNSKNGLAEDDNTFLKNLLAVPLWTPMQIKGRYVNYAGGSNNFNNPLAVIESGFDQTRVTRGYGINANLTFAPVAGILKGLTARAQMSAVANASRNKEFRPTYNVYDFARFGNNGLLYGDSMTRAVARFSGNNARIIEANDEANNYRFFFTAQYQRKLGLDHDFSVIVGGEQSQNSNTGVSIEYDEQKIPDQPYYWAFDPAQLRPPTIKGSEGAKRSFFGRYSYTYQGKYTLDGIVRFDASANFAANRLWGVFPTFGASWLVSEENFFKNNINAISYLKLRANYGITGDDRVSGTYWFERYKVQLADYLYGESLVTGVRPDVVPNPDITWEKKRTINFGVDISLFRNKFNITIDAFQDRSYDVFDKGNDQNYPVFAGFSAPILNYRIRHKWGAEYTFSYNTSIGKETRFRASMNFSLGNAVMERIFYGKYNLWENTPPNWVTSFGTDPRTYTSANYGLKAVGLFHTQQEVDAFLAKNPRYTINGMTPQPGWLQFRDIDGDGIITAKDKVALYNRIDPSLITGIQLGFSYKTFDCRVNIGASFGGKVFYDNDVRTSTPNTLRNVPAFWNDTWTTSNPNAKFPRADAPFISEISDFWAVDGTTIRVNDLTLAYSLPKNLVRKTGLSSIRLVATANNLCVIKNPLKYKDPEQKSLYDYPTLRTTSIGLNVSL